MKEYGFAFFGWVLWTVACLVIAKNPSDKAKIRFDWKGYFWETGDNSAFSFLMIFPLVWWMDDICSMLTMLSHKMPGVPETFTWPVWDLNYLGAGPLAELAYFGIEWLFTKKATLIKWMHKNDDTPSTPVPPTA